MDGDTVGWVISGELIGVIVTLIAGFGGLSYMIGRRSKDLEAVAGGLAVHEMKCAKRQKNLRKWQKKNDNRLAEGSTKMALLEERYAHLHEDVRAIREAVVKKPE